MRKRIVVLLILCLFLAGCWDKRELNELAITLAIGIDKVNDQYQVSAQVVIPSEVSMKGGLGSSAVTLFTATGDSIYEAIRKMTIESPRKIYPGHLQLLVISEELARDGIGESLDLFSRDWEPRLDFYVVIAKDSTANEILNVTTVLDSIPATKMFNSLHLSEKVWAGTKGVTLEELLTSLISDGREAVLTGIEVVGDKEIGSNNENLQTITNAAKVQYENVAVFKKDKLIGWLNTFESRGYNNLTDAIDTTVTIISCPDEGTATIEVIRSKTESKGTVKNGKPEVDVHIKAEGNVGEVQCKIDLAKLETIDELENIYEEEVKKSMTLAFEAAQKKYKSDIFGFGEVIHRSNPKEWKKMKENWNEEFTNLTLNIQVDLQIYNTGNINNTFLDKIRE